MLLAELLQVELWFQAQAACHAVVLEETVSAALDLPVWSDAMLACMYMLTVWSTILTRQASLHSERC